VSLTALQQLGLRIVRLRKYLDLRASRKEDDRKNYVRRNFMIHTVTTYYYGVRT
jgi:hypothetical protein